MLSLLEYVRNGHAASKTERLKIGQPTDRPLSGNSTLAGSKLRFWGGILQLDTPRCASRSWAARPTARLRRNALARTFKSGGPAATWNPE